MKAPAGPPRLRETEELGAALRLLDGDALAPERLARGAQQLEQRIAALALPAAGAGGAGGASALTAKAALLKLGLPLVLAAAVGGGTYLALRRPAERAPRSSTPAAMPVTPAAAPDAGPGRVALGPDAQPATAEAGPQRALRPAPVRRLAPPARASAPDAAPAITPALSVPAVPPTAAAAPTAPPSSLREQLRLFEEARQAGRTGDPTRALALLGQLLTRYPKSPLAAEARLSEAELLLRAGRLPAATAAVRRLLADPQHAGRRHELQRVLGDLLRRQGDCEGARTAYSRALAGAPPAAEARAAREGLTACEGR